jgi:serine protease inhibitor
MSLSSYFSATVFAVNCWQMSPRQFIANHPFVFAIRNIELAVVLFVGRFSHI